MTDREVMQQAESTLTFKDGVLEKQLREREYCLTQSVRRSAQIKISDSEYLQSEPVAKVVLTETLGLPRLQWFDSNRQFDFKGGELLFRYQPQRQWVELTSDEIADIAMQSGAYDGQLLTFARFTEAKLKEKNT